MIMDNNMMSLNISKDMLTPVIEQQVKLLMTELLGGSELIIDKVINNAINAKVDENGKPSPYGSNTKPLYEWLLTNEIKKAVQELMAEEVKSRAGNIKKALKKYIQSQKGADELSSAMITAFSNVVGDYWNAKFEIKLEKPSNY